ncbi:P-loop containing nucleoside triphosphate hydrolase protein [Fimicolochytrium jonesii]|uniref:P-loop containing nucleoside triphosphate hydrolase protein n=1 Tax=Fimicolochytrium jonesii TaxID=1396493 RepID=UPI0022FDFDEB|nr:P-loop containing nucleoside triphosphate hydrolase protein [Fimicolochytrium jonesii]KAI8819597.1 P-loop containing nucleoside triphosphate hydrolase protein [Fimicolochytrium jonesii]
MRESDRPAPVPDGWGPGGSVAAAGQDGGGSGSGSHHLANSTGESTTTHDGNLVAPETPTTNPSLHTATPTPTPAPTPHSHPDLTAELKRANITLNAYEKKLLTTVINPQNLTVSFSDLVLPSHTKTLLQTLTVLPLLKPHYYTAGVLARHSITGVLLFGPPGTGKSLLAKALAKHSAARFMSVALSDVYDKYVGEGEKNVKAIFTLARKLKPCVVFLDEVDALFARRGGVNDMPTRREVVNEFMSEWDGLGGNNQGLVIVGATNRPFDLDDAILRRMPRRIMVDLPKQPQRHAILSLHLRGEHLSPTLDLDRLARRTEKYSGSDLKNLCVAAALARIRDAVGGDEGLEKLVRVSGGGGESDPLKMPEEEVVVQGRPSDEKLPPLSNEHFETALKQVAPSLTDEMQTLVELKKWDERYGERKDPDRRGRDVWGFNG